MRSTRADWKLRSFTASGAEVFGAGHNALGARLWLREHGDLGSLATARRFQQEIESDVLPIELASIDGRVHGRMRQAPLYLSDCMEDVAPLTAALALDDGDILSEPQPRPADTGTQRDALVSSGRLLLSDDSPPSTRMNPMIGMLIAREIMRAHVEGRDPSRAATERR